MKNLFAFIDEASRSQVKNKENDEYEVIKDPQLKKKFGENRLVLSACNYSLEKLKEVCENNFSELVDVNEVKKEFIVLELKKDISKKQLLLALINSGVDIEKFGEYEPTLTDIFVLKAGDNNE